MSLATKLGRVVTYNTGFMQSYNTEFTIQYNTELKYNTELPVIKAQ